MSDSIGLLLFVQIVLIALNAVFASAEIALLSMSEAKISKLSSQGDKRAARLGRLIGEPAKFLATIQVAITLSGFLGSAFAADSFSEDLTKWILGLGVRMEYDVLEKIGQNRGFMMRGGEINTERTAITLLDEFRGAKIGRITLDRYSKEELHA